MPSSVASGAVETDRIEMGRKKYGIVYGICTTQLSSENGLFFLGQMRTFIPLVSAVNLHENVASLEIHGFRAAYGHRTHECRVRMDVILDVDEIASSCYAPYSPRQEIVHDVILTRIVRMRLPEIYG